MILLHHLRLMFNLYIVLYIMVNNNNMQSKSLSVLDRASARGEAEDGGPGRIRHHPRRD